ncbi:MAG: GNAT family N-acetyltransferase [Solirubrobacterales bacterium]|nr:GNAT family N-acetyltransferase [Solirubrobacterales bacterium]MBV9716399.1 GNAT family N-acetyltransferase [Solirubrobacterales bacterium]
MLAPTELRAASPPRRSLQIWRAEIPSPEFSRFLYTAVGARWYWLARLGWSYAEWEGHLDRPEVETWVAYMRGTPAGYFELEGHVDGTVEITQIGLLPAFIGQGFGAHLLTVAVERAWTIGASRVVVHTFSLDHPNALANYRARGFRVFEELTGRASVPEEPPGPWPRGH